MSWVLPFTNLTPAYPSSRCVYDATFTARFSLCDLVPLWLSVWALREMSVFILVTIFTLYYYLYIMLSLPFYLSLNYLFCQLKVILFDWHILFLATKSSLYCPLPLSLFISSCVAFTLLKHRLFDTTLFIHPYPYFHFDLRSKIKDIQCSPPGLLWKFPQSSPTWMKFVFVES